MNADVAGNAPRWRDRDLGALPVLAALAVLWLAFQLLNDKFLSADNLVNLTLQSVTTGVLALGIVLVLLVGQIDLSVGAVSGLAAAVVAVTFMQLGWPLVLAVLAAVVLGAAVGAVYGLVIARLRLPSFLVTLAGLLVCLGLQLRVLGSTGSVNLPYESWLVRFGQQTFLLPVASYMLVAVVVLGYAGAALADRHRRAVAELPTAPTRAIAARSGGLAVALLLPVAYLNTNRGVGATFALFLALVLVADVVLRRTRWGRWARAIGSDAESARRAGLPVRRVTVSVFAACTGLAALAGVLSVSRLAAANQGTGGSDLNLTAIAAAVIGGTSLFGGRGNAWSALLGVVVISSISSGLTLINLDSSVRYVITGLVLAVALAADAFGRRSRAA